MARWGCQGCLTTFGAWLSRCPRCRSAKGLVQVLNACKSCTARFAVGLPKCPHCGSTDFEEDWKVMPKNTVHGGPSNATAGPDEPGYMPAAQTTPDGLARTEQPLSDADAEELAAAVAEPGPQGSLPFSATRESLASEGNEQPSPDPGINSSTPSEKPPTSPKTSETEAPSPARKTASRSKKAQTGSPSVPSTAGDPTGAPSATASDDKD